jgi:hypothetical protein
MTKEKVHHKVQTMFFFFGHWIVYFILYYFFGHWIVCTLFCTFSLAIGLFVLFLWPLDCLLYFVLFLEKEQNKGQTMQWPKKKYKIKDRQSNDQRKSTK